MRHEAPGLPADWLNGWLAAIGVTMLVPGIRLRWTDDGVPTAVFEADQPADLAVMVAGALPTPAMLARSVIAKALPANEHEFGRKVRLAAFRERAVVERRTREGFLAASVSDLSVKLKPDDLEHGAFDPPAPAGTTLCERATRCAAKLARANIVARVRDTLAGSGQRENLNGLGFDPRRFPEGTHPAGEVGVYADPVVELLVFGALPLFPVRGDGRWVRQRLWTDSNTKRGAFGWFAWRPALDRWGIDALLDLPSSAQHGFSHAVFTVVPYQPDGNETNRAYFSERVQ